MPILATTHNLDIQVTEARVREASAFGTLNDGATGPLQGESPTEYAIDVFEVGGDFISRTWHTYAEVNALLQLLRTDGDEEWLASTADLLPGAAWGSENVSDSLVRTTPTNLYGRIDILHVRRYCIAGCRQTCPAWVLWCSCARVS